MSEPCRGSIVRLLMKNFMSFSYFEWRPDCKFNVVLGSNGSGKSTFMCAICLLMGGRPSLSGRSGRIGKYVKNGQSMAEIEIELYKANRNQNNLVIMRRISATEPTSKSGTFYLNNTQVDKKAILEAIGELNIDMENLCQYLPQDRVSEFNKKSPYDLLRDIECSIEHKRLLRLHDELIDCGVGNKTTNHKLQFVKSQIVEKQAEIEKMDEQLEMEREVEMLEEKMLRLQVKIEGSELNDKLLLLTAENSEMSKLELDVEQKEKEVECKRKKVVDVQNLIAMEERERSEYVQQILQYQELAKKCLESHRNHKHRTKSLENELLDLEKQENECSEEILTCQKFISFSTFKLDEREKTKQNIDQQENRDEFKKKLEEARIDLSANESVRESSLANIHRAEYNLKDSQNTFAVL